jgi:hypothetical protein
MDFVSETQGNFGSHVFLMLRIEYSKSGLTSATLDTVTGQCTQTVEEMGVILNGKT